MYESTASINSMILSSHLASPFRPPSAEPRIIGVLSPSNSYLLSKSRTSSLTFELDVFEGAYQGLILAEVEFASEEDAVAFTPPEWCARDVTWSGEYQNSRLAMEKG